MEYRSVAHPPHSPRAQEDWEDVLVPILQDREVVLVCTIESSEGVQEGFVLVGDSADPIGPDEVHRVLERSPKLVYKNAVLRSERHHDMGEQGVLGRSEVRQLGIVLDGVGLVRLVARVDGLRPSPHRDISRITKFLLKLNRLVLV